MIKKRIREYKQNKLEKSLDLVDESLPDDVVVTDGEVTLTPLPPFVKIVVRFSFVN